MPRSMPYSPLVLVTALFVCGCSLVSSSRETETPEIPSLPEPEPNGSIYQIESRYQPLFEDRRPNRIGDLLTVVLDEAVSASKDSRSSAARNGIVSLAPQGEEEGLSSLADYAFDIEAENAFEGGGGSRASNTFTGTITVTVVDVLPNGNLRVQGEKQIAINQGREYIRFAGVVDPKTITSSMTVPSTLVAGARIEYVGDGYIDRSQRMGWLQRLLLRVSPF